MNSLSDGTTTVVLDDDLYWSDEGSWQPVAQAVNRTITGALDIQVTALVGGRPITLEPEDDSSGWMHRAAVAQLLEMAQVPGQQLTLTFRGSTYNVLFRHQDTPLDYRPVVHYNTAEASDYMLCTIRLMEI